LIRAPHEGIVAALNRGLAGARGGLIARMDADDVSLPERLAIQKRFLEEHPQIGMVGCCVRHVGDADRQAGYARYVEWTNRLLLPEDIAANRFVESPFAHPSVMFRRELIERHGAYREGGFPEDYELWLRWLDAGVRMQKLPATLLEWSDYRARLSRNDARYDVEAFHRIKAGYLARWLVRHNPLHPRVIVWGAGRVTRRRAGLLRAQGVEITAYVDIDPAKIGRMLDGVPVMAPDELPAPGRAFVIPWVANVSAREQIAGHLEKLGYRLARDYLPAA
jgi:glycosyltransferase involved in cell wall biosynthesis